MKLIFRHHAPATGKLTVASALLRVVPGKLFHNHAAIDVARTVFDFGAPGLWALAQTVGSSVLDAAALHGVPLVVATYCYAEPADVAGPTRRLPCVGHGDKYGGRNHARNHPALSFHAFSKLLKIAWKGNASGRIADRRNCETPTV